MKAICLTTIAAILVGCAKEATVEPKEPETLLPAKVELVSPAQGDTIRIGQPVTLVCRTFAGASQYSFRIIQAGNSSNYITGTIGRDTTFTVTPTGNWPSQIWWQAGVAGNGTTFSSYRTLHVRP